MPLRRTLLFALPLALALTTAACAGSAGEPTVDLSVAAIPDVNPTSASFERDVHPDDYAGSISAWYFGHAT
ncbi:hypothetical protein G6O69_07955 [Pseudenhygromyxa sp. WMMC2535]|uniref:hypothetical protein n=1 Tax=Pseudenhygromyxa sp. WMMC2535 TaxID=2712867 RepID=UPI0015560726|nr:hypothetical protein [Pseudenhygromyxa sp. WMMC2535]NVB37763.1 hypothetical protein [Pseudenhygromyxa sp. WMMC2535]